MFIIKPIWLGQGTNSKLIIVLARYEFICQAHIKLITKPINEPRSNLFCIEP